MVFDRFKTETYNMDAPCGRAIAVSPSDTVDLAEVTTRLYIGTAGTLKADLYEQGVITTVTFGGTMPVGFHQLRVSRVWSTGTSAAAIVACY
jgi:hypothetical protein